MRLPPVRLLQIASTSEMGGAEQIILNVLRYADPPRLQPSVLALMERGPLARLAAQTGCQATNWALSSIRDPRLIRRMQLFLRRGNYDVVQCYGLRADALTRWVAHGMGIKVISSVCSIDPWRSWYHLWLDRLTADGVTAWMSTSEAGRRSRIQREGFPASRFCVVPTGIPDRRPAGETERTRARQRLKIAEDAGPVLAVLANIRPAKGHADLIEALPALIQRWPKLVCLCAGRDDSGGAIPKLAAERGLDKNVQWLGFRADAPAIYDAADLAVLPSHWEGMPLALIEALRAGMPTVATDVGGNSEVVRHEREGLLCQPKAPRDLGSAIKRALEDEPARRAWGECARKRYESEFRVELMVERMTDFYEKLLGRA